MGFDVGKAVASGLVLGAIYGTMVHGTKFVSRKIEAWKQAQWEKRNKGLDPRELAERSRYRERRRKRTSRLIMGSALLLLVVGLFLLAELTKT